MKIIKMVDLPQLPEEAKALLEAIGCLQVRSLAVKDPDALCADLVKANTMLKINTRNPELSDVKKWVLSAIEEVGEEAVSESCDEEDLEEVVSETRHEEPTVKIDAKNDAEITERLQFAPVAEKLDPHLIRKQNIAVLDIPQAILISECEGSIEIRDIKNNAEANDLTVDDEGSGIQDAESSAAQKVSVSPGSLEGSKAQLNEETGFRDFDSVNKGEHHIKPLDRGERETSKVTPDLNENVTPDSRRYIKGVLHPDPWVIKLPAFCLIFFLFSLFINLIGLPCVLIANSGGEHNILIAFLLLAILGASFLLYLYFAVNSSCRVCGQKQFIPKQCIKHKKAHYSSLLGYMLPTALQAILYHWFYCIYCGTAIRLKK